MTPRYSIFASRRVAADRVAPAVSGLLLPPACPVHALHPMCSESIRVEPVHPDRGQHPSLQPDPQLHHEARDHWPGSLEILGANGIDLCLLDFGRHAQMSAQVAPSLGVTGSVPAGSDPAGRIGWQLSVKRTRYKPQRRECRLSPLDAGPRLQGLGCCVFRRPWQLDSESECHAWSSESS